MSVTLIIAEHRKDALLPITAQCVRAAVALKSTPVVAVVGSHPVVEAAAALSGVDRVLHIAAGEFDTDGHRTATLSLIAALEPDLVLTGHTAQSMGFAPAAAAQAGRGLVTDAISLSKEGGALIAERAFYGGKLRGEVELAPGRAFVTLRGGEYDEAEPGATAPVETFNCDLSGARTAHEGFSEAMPDDDGIENADIILSVGRGVGEEEELARFQELAEKLGAAFAVSRPLVDAGWMPVSRQVGQSGKTVTPKLYIALGISGASQHLAGIKGAETVIAVNTDPTAGIFSVARFGAHCDMHDLAGELEDLLD